MEKNKEKLIGMQKVMEGLWKKISKKRVLCMVKID